MLKIYCPILLLRICGKIFERLKYNKMFEYFIKNDLIPHNQSGLPHSLQWSPIYRNQPNDLLCKSMDWSLYDRDSRQQEIHVLTSCYLLNMRFINLLVRATKLEVIS